MTVDGENRHYTAIKNKSRLLSKLNGKSSHTCGFCINHLNCFWTPSSRDKQEQDCSNNGYIKVKVPSDKKKWLKFHDGQYQLKFPFVLGTNFESIWKPVDKQYREKLAQMKAEQKTKTPNTEKINKYTVWRVGTQHFFLWRCSGSIKKVP